MKKNISLILAAFVLSAAAASCSSEPAGSTPDQTDSAAQITEAETVQDGEESIPEETEEEYVEPDYPELVADENSITFDDGDLYTAHCMNENNFENDESNCRLSVADFKGTKQLKIEVLDFDNEKGKYKTPKIVFDMDELVGSENLSKVKSFSCDLTQAAAGDFRTDDGTMLHVPGNFMGTFGSNIGEDCSDWYVPNGSSSEYAAAEWQCSWVHLHVDGKWLLKGYVDGTTDSTLVFMRWSIPNQADVYIDNLTFYDEEGKSIPLVYKSGEGAADAEGESDTSDAEVTEAEEEVTEAAENTGGENGTE
ncbi:hypothetical protein [Ruminococcus sp. HUN007]|uniref:hypothetical protein n=1 Tax=Ruminococcus sp. HUN007 TaxID=1514668 RepID=UPI0005D153BB|nr:hypothetical protein [Ruminococcus sp. HUN007]